MRKLTAAFGSGLLLLLSFASPSMGYEEIAVSNGGTITGFVKISGKTPNLPPLQITKFKDVCQNVPNESLVVGPGLGVRYAVVTLEGIAKGRPLEREAMHELDNNKCRFVPRVLAASVGQFLVLKNTDPILHTAHAYFRDQPHFNVGLYPGRVSRKPLISAGLVKILCEVHPWMSAYIVVTEHPYNAVTDVYGDYEIRDVPAGVYQLKVWHESLGAQEKLVDVKAGGVSQVDFTFSQAPGAKR